MTGRRPAPAALTVDAWYTLYYLSASEHRALDARRRRVWSHPFLRAGLSRREVDDLLARRERWVREVEAGGRTPTVPEQLRRLGAWSGRTVDPTTFVDELDRTLGPARIQVAPGAARALRELSDRNVPVGLVSNVLNESGAVARGLLDRLGLLPWFRVVYLSCEHPWAKPSPRPFRHVLRYLGVPPHRAAHLGDLGYDVRGARAAGLVAWWYVGLGRLSAYLPGQVRPGEVRSADTIRSWSELPRRFDGLAGRR